MEFLDNEPNVNTLGESGDLLREYIRTTNIQRTNDTSDCLIHKVCDTQRDILRSNACSICTQLWGFVRGSCVSISPFSRSAVLRIKKNKRIALLAFSLCKDVYK